MKTKLFLLLSAITFLFSCKKDHTSDDQVNARFEASVGGVYVSCEGKFMDGSAGVTYYNGSSQTTRTDAYYDANSEALGDVCQSLCRIGNKTYLVVNNSGKIVVTNTWSLGKTNVITGFTSPRYMLPVSADKAYVSDLYSNSIQIVNLNTNTITGHVGVLGSSENMLLKDGLVYVTDMSMNFLYRINAGTDQLVDSFPISPGGNSICEDKNGKIWIVCGGDYLTGSPGGLNRFDPTTNTVDLTLPFSANEFPTRLHINSTGDTLYYISTHVYKMAITETALPASPFIVSGGRTLYGLGLEPGSGKVFVSDAKDFQQAGRVYIYDRSGTETANFATGIAPGEFLFLN